MSETKATIKDVLSSKIVPLTDISIDLVVEEIYKSLKEGKYSCAINTSIGELSVYYTDISNNFNIKWKFKPSNELLTKLTRAISKDECPLADDLEKEIKNKLERTYKEVV